MSTVPHSDLVERTQLELERHEPHKPHPGHPGAKEYVAIAVILAVLTGVEVAVYYIHFLSPVLIPILMVLMVTKFSMVALFFMHLRFDSRLFSLLFVGGLLLAVTVFLIFLTLFRTFFASSFSG